MVIEAGSTAERAILGTTVTGQGDQQRPLECRHAPELTSDVKTIHAWQADIENDDIGDLVLDVLPRCEAVGRDRHSVASGLQEGAERRGGVFAVIDKQDLVRRRRLAGVRLALRHTQSGKALKVLNRTNVPLQCTVFPLEY
jgi:hypothetical protein